MDTNGVGHTGDSTLLRKVNESAVLDLIQTRGPITRSQLARELRLSPPTITRIVTALIESGLVYEHSSASSSGGRRPTLVDFNARANLIIGVYIGREMVGALADLNGEILHRDRAPSCHGEEGVCRLIEFVQSLHEKARQLHLTVRGVGIGAPSIVTQPEGVVILAPTLDWRDVPLRQRLEDALGVPAFVQNEINLIALGEQWRGAGRGIDNMVCISLGEGIGAGLIVGGQLFNGSHFAAGEIGYLVPNARFLGRTYETFGSLESEAGSFGIVRRYLERRAAMRLAEGQPGPLRADSPPTVDAVLQAAREGDAIAQAVVDETVEYLTIAIANLAAIMDPQRVILTGELIEFGDLFLEPVRARIRGLVPAVPEIALSELGMDAAVFGALAIALRSTSDALRISAFRS